MKIKFLEQVSVEQRKKLAIAVLIAVVVTLFLCCTVSVISLKILRSDGNYQPDSDAIDATANPTGTITPTITSSLTPTLTLVPTKKPATVRPSLTPTPKLSTNKPSPTFPETTPIEPSIDPEPTKKQDSD